MAADLNPPLGTTTPEIFMDNVKRADELVNGPAGTVDDRGGEPLDTWRQMMAKNDEVRQNIIPLSKQYMTLEAAQADIANIPEGSTTYYRSPDDSALAIEVMNVGGTLTTTGRTMASGELVADIDQRISQVDGENITEIHDDTGNVIGYLAADGRLFLPYLNEAVQDILSRLSGLVSSRGGADIFSFGDGKNDTFIQASDGRIYVPLLQMSIQDEINGLKKNVSTSPAIASVDTRNQVGSAAYIVVPEGYLVDQIKWLRDGVVIPGATGHAYVLTSSDMMKKITMTIGSLLGGNRVSDKTAGQIGGIALESAGPTGSLYEGFTLSAGDDFNALDIITPANPLGRWFTTRTYLNPPRGSDTLLGTMYDTDPAFTGFSDSNRGIPVGFDNMRAVGGVLRLQARTATDAEKVFMQGSRHELAAMVSSVGAFSFYAGPAGSGDCIIEWYAMFTHKSQNPAGWHPSLWTQSSLPSYTYNSDEMDIVEGTSQFATSNYNIWGSDGSRTGGGSLGPEKDIFDGRYHKVTAILNQSQVRIYIDDVLSSTTAIDANAVREPGYLLMSSHVYNGTFHGEAYSALAWEQLWKGATINVDWCRIWRKTGLSHIKPLVAVSSVNIDYGNSGTILLPAKSALWGREDVLENVQVVMTEENEPGGSHTVPYNTLPPFVTYDAVARTITIGNGYTKAGRLNFVIYGYL
ncbi:hypothetical protein [Klebsiella michiganensis]|uniref:hypothetical protein n=1 Tax=Klebsiella michiganensis TaxID=1134687 RepID=UPI00255ABE27|nr:hypothetical protein [Klebsiella michiganensis]MDL4446650.1 hypothetical protein [Klebsiella michiganensis]MDL4490554.1 hypothetical protein [Klebsiella michiganensis]MDL4659295.1 hypothetical protein [Klebsiella michiganensis]